MPSTSVKNCRERSKSPPRIMVCRMRMEHLLVQLSLEVESSNLRGCRGTPFRNTASGRLPRSHRTPSRISTAFPVHDDCIAAEWTRHRLTTPRTTRPDYFRRFVVVLRMRSAMSLLLLLVSVCLLL